MKEEDLGAPLTEKVLNIFCQLVLNKWTWERHSIAGKSVGRFSTAALATLENALCVALEQKLKRKDITGLREAIKLQFIKHAQAFSPHPIFMLDDLVIDRTEQEMVVKSFNYFSGRTTTLEALLSSHSSLADWFGAIQPVRFAGFVGILYGPAKEDLSTALRMAFSFWFYGRHPADPEEMAFIDEVATAAHSVSVSTVDAMIPAGGTSSSVKVSDSQRVTEESLSVHMQGNHRPTHSPGGRLEDNFEFYYQHFSTEPIFSRESILSHGITSETYEEVRRGYAALMAGLIAGGSWYRSGILPIVFFLSIVGIPIFIALQWHEGVMWRRAKNAAVLALRAAARNDPQYRRFLDGGRLLTIPAEHFASVF